jgi:hypothetical protein
MAARGDGGRMQPPFADGPIDSLLAHAEEPRCFFRADELTSAPAWESSRSPRGGDPFNIFWEEPAVTSWGDRGGLELPPCHGAKHSRPAYAKAIC